MFRACLPFPSLIPRTERPEWFMPSQAVAVTAAPQDSWRCSAYRSPSTPGLSAPAGPQGWGAEPPLLSPWFPLPGQLGTGRPLTRKHLSQSPPLSDGAVAWKQDGNVHLSKSHDLASPVPARSVRARPQSRLPFCNLSRPVSIKGPCLKLGLGSPQL